MTAQAVPRAHAPSGGPGRRPSGARMNLPLPSARSGWFWLGAAVLATAALLAGVPLQTVTAAAGTFALLYAATAALDLARALRAWRAAPLALQRRLPAALALGVKHELVIVIDNPGGTAWRATLFDHPDGRLQHAGLPLGLALAPRSRTEARYTLLPLARGGMRFAPAALRLATPWRLFELQVRLGREDRLRVYPDFAKLARYAWLAGDKRLSEMGIKSYAQRGEGTDFKELAEYRTGDDVRHIDWKATLRFARPIVREFQDERDQCVTFLLDCGRRMRAAEGEASLSHFDHALNAMLLLAWVALSSGDEVGATTFGHAAGEERHFAPRKGLATLHALMAALHDVQPVPEQADLQRAAAALMRRQPRRSLVVVLTNFRDEDLDEVAPALALLRTRHLVLLASLREGALAESAALPLGQAAAVRRVAAAHLLEQARRDAFARLAARDLLLVDCEPQALAPALVNRYHAVKRAGLL